MSSRNFFQGLLAVALCLGFSSEAQDASEVAPRQITRAQVSGDTITLQADEVDIRSFLRLLAQERRLNIVAGPEVQGLVSINLFGVPFEEALDSILGVAGFTRYQKGNIIFVTTEAGKATLPINVRDLELKVYEIKHVELNGLLQSVREFLSPSGKAVVNQEGGGAASAGGGGAAGGGTTGQVGVSIRGKLMVQDAPEYLAVIDGLVAALDQPPHGKRIFEIGHSNPDDVVTTISAFLSPSGVVQRGTENFIIVQDSAEYLADIGELISVLDRPPRQVLIRARILSVNFNNDLELGVNFLASTLSYSNPLSSAAPGVGDFTRDVAAGETGGAAGLLITAVSENIQGAIDALSLRSNVETLSAPQLLTVDGQTATIQVGQNLGYPVTVTELNGRSSESTEFLSVGTMLEVTPKISDDGLILLTIHPEVSTGVISPSGSPQEQTAEATTVMLVRDGETVLIGGLITTSRQRARRQVPIIGNIPILGFLFGRNTWKDARSELIILVTPHVVGAEATDTMREEAERVERRREKLLKVRSDSRMLFERKTRREEMDEIILLPEE